MPRATGVDEKPAPRRVVLIDFDWQDVESMLRVVSQPSLTIRLVVGEDDDNAGVHLAELSHLPRSIDLADLDGETIDLALVSERCSRPAEVERLLAVLGIPWHSPSQFLDGDAGAESIEANDGDELDEDRAPDLEGDSPWPAASASTRRPVDERTLPIEKPLPEGLRPKRPLLQGAPMQSQPQSAPLRPRPLDTSPLSQSQSPPSRPRPLDASPWPQSQSVPSRPQSLDTPPRSEPQNPPSRPQSLDTPPRSEPQSPPSRPQFPDAARELPGVDLIPAPEDREGIARLLATLVTRTGATQAELRMGGPENMETVVGIGTTDLMVETLIELAVRHDSDQVIRSIATSGEDRFAGAWPIRTPLRFAVVSASGMEPGSPWADWKSLAERLRVEWTEHDQIDEPETPSQCMGWELVEDFRVSLERTIDLNENEETSFSLQRYRFSSTSPALDELCELLPRNLRGGDLLCRPSPKTILLLTEASPSAFFRVHQRFLQLWEGCWQMCLDEPPNPKVDIESVELLSPDQALEFLSRAADWLAPAD